MLFLACDNEIQPKTLYGLTGSNLILDEFHDTVHIAEDIWMLVNRLAFTLASCLIMIMQKHLNSYKQRKVLIERNIFSCGGIREADADSHHYIHWTFYLLFIKCNLLKVDPLVCIYLAYYVGICRVHQSQRESQDVMNKDSGATSHPPAPTGKVFLQASSKFIHPLEVC